MDISVGDVNFNSVHPMRIRVYFSHSFLEGTTKFLGRLGTALESHEDLVRLYEVTIPPSDQILSDIEIVRNKIIAIVPLESEPPMEDELAKVKRPLVYQAGNFAAQGFASFSAVADPSMNVEQLLHGKFFPATDCKVWMEDIEIADHPIIHLNRNTMDFVHLQPAI